MKQLLFLFTLSLFSASCGSNANGCKMGKPQPMFEAGLKGISNHNFILKEDNTSNETFNFNGAEIIVYQSGCEFVSQEFQFNFKEKTGDDKDGMEKIAGILMAWSKMGKKQESFAAWAKQIRVISSEMLFGQTFNPSPNIEIGLDRINKMDGELITLTLEQKS